MRRFWKKPNHRDRGAFMVSPLKALSNLIAQSVDAIEGECEKQGLSFPSIDGAFTVDSEAIRNSPSVAKEIALICAAAQQLSLIVRPPNASLVMQAAGFANSAALRVAIELHVSEILRASGESGLHVNDIASQSKVDPKKLSRILRLLATNGVFREIAPDIFANNRLSSALDKHQDPKILFSSPDKIYDKPESSPIALLGHFTDECAKASTFMFESFIDPATAFSGEVSDCAFTKAFNITTSMWDLFESPGNEHRLRRFGIAMEGTGRTDPIDKLLARFDWSTITEGSKIVDVGGGIGTVSIKMAKTQPNFKYIVQDRAAVVAEGLKRLEHSDNELVSSGTLSFQAHNFFQAQPIVDASIFFMKAIVHDWSDKYAKKILDHLRDAARPETKLLVVDRIVPYACRIAETGVNTIPGIIRENIPEPIPGNMGAGGPTPYFMDFNMLSLMNGQERTIGHFVDLFEGSGWKIVRVYQINGFARFASLIEAIPT